MKLKNWHVFNTTLPQFERLLAPNGYLCLSQNTLESNIRNWVRKYFLWKVIVKYSILGNQMETSFWFQEFQRFLWNLGGTYLLKSNNRNNRTRCEICSKLTIKKPEQRQWCRSGVLLLTLNILHTLP